MCINKLLLHILVRRVVLFDNRLFEPMHVMVVGSFSCNYWTMRCVVDKTNYCMLHCKGGRTDRKITRPI